MAAKIIKHFYNAIKMAVKDSFSVFFQAHCRILNANFDGALALQTWLFVSLTFTCINQHFPFPKMSVNTDNGYFA